VNYRLIYTRRALRDIERLDPRVRDRIGTTLRPAGLICGLMRALASTDQLSVIPLPW